MFEKEFQYYIDHQKDLVEKYQNKFIVIIGEEVIGVYDTLFQSIEETEKNHEPGSFFIQECLPGEDNYTITYHSRVVYV